MTSKIIEVLRYRVLDIMGRGSPRTRNGHAEGPASRTAVATGTVTALRDREFGSIARDAPSDRADLFFHRSMVVGDGFDRLHTGQRVTFSEERDPHDHNRQRAIGVRPVDGGHLDVSGAVPESH